MLCSEMSLPFMETLEYIEAIHTGFDGAKNPENKKK